MVNNSAVRKVHPAPFNDAIIDILAKQLINMDKQRIGYDIMADIADSFDSIGPTRSDVRDSAHYISMMIDNLELIRRYVSSLSNTGKVRTTVADSTYVSLLIEALDDSSN